MSPLIESVKIENGRCFLTELHQERLNRSRRLLFGCTGEIQLEEWLRVPEELDKLLLKCRITYTDKILNMEYEPYQKRRINRLKIVYHDTIDYSFKFKDRHSLMELYAQRGDCDEIAIVKNGYFTDSSYANLVFDDGRELYTPRQPLLQGVKRTFYLQSGAIKEADISPADLPSFQRIHLINAMLDLGACVVGRLE